MQTFVPVAPGRKGRRGFESEPTRRLVDLRNRYRQLRDDPKTDAGLKAYSRDIVHEIGAELRRRNVRREAVAA